MKLVELAEKWKNREITDEELKEIIPTIKVFLIPRLQDETDDTFTIAIDGNSWDEVLEDVFNWNEDLFFEFQEVFVKYKKIKD